MSFHKHAEPRVLRPQRHSQALHGQSGKQTTDRRAHYVSGIETMRNCLAGPRVIRCRGLEGRETGSNDEGYLATLYLTFTCVCFRSPRRIVCLFILQEFIISEEYTFFAEFLKDVKDMRSWKEQRTPPPMPFIPASRRRRRRPPSLRRSEHKNCDVFEEQEESDEEKIHLLKGAKFTAAGGKKRTITRHSETFT